jgi:UDP-N-acetylmuramoyl-tripeptide--D-alanyl-D-alanine ligase
LQPGDLFVALKDVRDGHEFVAAALNKGAGAALVSHVPEGVAEDAPLLIVDDVLPALEALASAARARTGARVIGVTGSVGKTSTKDMLAHVLGRQGKTHAAAASYNNHWGVPLTLARMPPDTAYAVIEIGMSAPGEIAPLSKLARPQVAVITTVAAAHLEAFDSIEGIAAEKAAIFDGLEPEGTAILPADLDVTPVLRAGVGAAQVIDFGEAPGSDWPMLSAQVVGETTVVETRFNGEKLIFKTGAPGVHFGMNALAVLAAVNAVGADVAVAACDLATWHPTAGRGTREVLSLDPVVDDMTITLMDDAFNANPASMAASFEVLAATHPEDGIGRIQRGRRIAILGDMLELGPDEARLHAGLAELPAIDAVSVVHCVGPRMAALWHALPEPKRGVQVAAPEDILAKTHDLFDAGDVVLVKGSKGSRISLVVDAIRKLGHPPVRAE